VGGLPAGTVNGLAVDPTNPKVMLVAMRDGVFRSDDAGARWTPGAGSPKSVVAVAIHPTRPSEAWAVTAEGRLHVSRDGGQRWEPAR
jgi:photosystem II stability/assembly factor-like uncharacterized protein